MMDKRYDSVKVEKKWQDLWDRNGSHKFDPDASGEVFSIDTPPPFTSGTLHMGHVFNHVWIDIAARYKRMQGFNVYLPQGFDCHGLPTELQVEENLKIPKEDRDAFIAACIDWTDKAITKMRGQFNAIGYSSDWDYTYRTMDEDYKAMVQKSLLDFYGMEKLYRGKHPIIWCTNCRTALAKAEIGYIEKEGKLYHIDLDVEGEALTIATTRPEMMPSCVAVFVHPDDDRYTSFVGKKAVLPIGGRSVPVMADDVVDREFGTGVVYLCTFGDEQDIAWQRKYDLPVIECIDDAGIMTDAAGEYAGMVLGEAREVMLVELKDKGVLKDTEKLVHNVLCHTERGSCKTPIELLPMEQWFIKVKEHTADIIEAAETMNWYPGYMLGRLKSWAESMDWDWIISRQRVFGTPIPFWVCACGTVIAAKEDELPVDPRGTSRKCPDCGSDARGEVDVCDCWVDSSVSPLRISKWGIDDDFFDKTYPVSLRPQGYEIIRTWAFYTIFRDLILTGRPCFKDLLINGMVAGPDGRKMSKSLKNVIEPEKPLSKYSADTLRQWAAGGSLGDDYPFNWEECEHSQKFLTKLWNVSRFISMHLEDFEEGDVELRAVDEWMLSKLNNLVADCTSNLDSYVFNIPLMAIRSFVWHELADDYLEMVKHRLYRPEEYGAESRRAAQYTLNRILKTCLKLLSPFTPHIVDEIWENIMRDGQASSQSWPSVDGDYEDKSVKAGDLATKIISGVRKYKSENNMSLGVELESIKVRLPADLKDMIELIAEDVKGTGKISNLDISFSDIGEPILDFDN